jgi:hypothetical protein
MTNTPMPKPEKVRTTAQLWSRRERINQHISELQAERAEIDAKLEAELQKK